MRMFSTHHQLPIQIQFSSVPTEVDYVYCFYFAVNSHCSGRLRQISCSIVELMFEALTIGKLYFRIGIHWIGSEHNFPGVPTLMQPFEYAQAVLVLRHEPKLFSVSLLAVALITLVHKSLLAG